MSTRTQECQKKSVRALRALTSCRLYDKPPNHSFFRRLKRNNEVFIIPLLHYSLKLPLFHYSVSQNLIIPFHKITLFHYSREMLLSMIIPKETSLFRYSRKTKAIIPLHKFPLFLFHYSSSAPDILIEDLSWCVNSKR